MREIKKMIKEDWVYVNEKKPRAERKVLIYTNDGEYYVAYRTHKEWQTKKYEWYVFGVLGYALTYEDNEVVAWMPLPNKPVFPLRWGKKLKRGETDGSD